jgi:hypothetical protein
LTDRGHGLLLDAVPIRVLSNIFHGPVQTTLRHNLTLGILG